MAGIARSGFQAIANAVWSLVALASRTVNVTTFNGTTGTFSGGKPHVVASPTIKHYTGTITTGTASVDVDVSSAGLTNTEEAIIHPTSVTAVSSVGSQLTSLHFRFISTTTVRISMGQGTSPSGEVCYFTVEKKNK